MKQYLKLSLLCWGLTLSYASAQVGMPTNNPNKDAVLDLNRTDGTSAKGLLLPNVALKATNDVVPMTANVAGMHVWNTATDGVGVSAVTPGEYFNDGNKWVRVASSADAWIQDGNNNGAIKAIGTNDNFDLPIETNGNERMRVTSDGNVGIGTSVPTSKLEVKSGTANTSGLKFSDLNASTPISSGAALGVDETGNVVTVKGNTFSPASGIGSVPNATTIVVSNNTTNTNICSITLPEPGTYLIIYTVRSQWEFGGILPNSGQYGRAFVSTAASTSSILPNTEMLISYLRNGNNSGIILGGGNNTGMTTYTVTNGSQNLYLGVENIKSTPNNTGTLPMSIASDGQGRTNISYVKIF